MHEPQRILEEWSGTTSEYRSDCTLWDLFAEWVGQTPNSIALIHDGSRISYGQLDELADKVAADLESHGVESGSRVGVFMERTPAMVAAILGILKVGAAYLPLDPKYPKDRIDFILDDAQASAVITEPGLRPQVAQCGALVICPGDTASSPRKPLDSERTNRRADDLAYVIYTSGSTGRPKGVAIEHRSAVALLAWARSVYDH